MTGPDLSLVVPVYNERENLAPLVEEIDAVARRHGWSYELLLVNDGSDDGSAEMIDALAARRPEIRGLHLDRNHGQSAAIAAGFAHARGQWIVTLDADGQNDPADIPALIDLLGEYDLAIGYRAKRVDGWVRRATSWIANRIRNLLTGDRVIDTGCSLKVFRAELLRKLPLYSDMHRFIPAISMMATDRIAEVVVRHHARKFGISKYGLTRIIKVIPDLVTLKMLVSFSRRPMHWFGGWAA